jgi:hypothetical protein
LQINDFQRIYGHLALPHYIAVADKKDANHLKNPFFQGA